MTGYTPLHFGAMWGRVSCLKLLVNVGSADQRLKTKYGETVRDLSQRYNQTDCTVYLECAGECVCMYPFGYLPKLILLGVWKFRWEKW